jgi:hypothetical protein
MNGTPEVQMSEGVQSVNPIILTKKLDGRSYVPEERRRRISATLMGRETKPAIDRFMSHVEKDESGCWNWCGTRKKAGYGSFSICKNTISITYNAHRWSYAYYRGEIPEDMTIDHLCRNRRCVNPWHMEVVTIQENLSRGDSICAVHARRKVCKRGHDLIPIPATRTTTAKRHCPICENIDALQWNKEHREQKNRNNRLYHARKVAKNPQRKPRVA